jgi:hypothetical protein
MAENNVTTMGNMFDMIKFKLPNNTAVQSIAATLAERDPWTRYTPSLPANSGVSHTIMRQISLPTGYLVDAGGSWKESKAEFEPDVAAMFTLRSTYRSNPDYFLNMPPEVASVQLRAQKASHVMALAQGRNNLMLNGSTAPNQSSIRGLMQMKSYATYDGKFCFSAGGTGDDKRSCWLCKPGIDTVYALHNSFHPTMGIKMEDKGEVFINSLGTNSDEHRWDIFIEFMLQAGFVVEDQRALKRICNVDCGLTDNPGSELMNAIIDASIINAPTGGTLMEYSDDGTIVNELQSPWILYCDERLYSKLVRNQNDKLFVYTSEENIYRTKLTMIGNDIIVARWDALNHAVGSGESAVSEAS